MRKIERIVSKTDPLNILAYLILNDWKCVHTYPDLTSSLWEKKGKSVRLIKQRELYSDSISITIKLIVTVSEVDRGHEDVTLYGIVPTIEKINHILDLKEDE